MGSVPKPYLLFQSALFTGDRLLSRPRNLISNAELWRGGQVETPPVGIGTRKATPRLLGRLRQFFNCGSCLAVSPLNYFVAAGAWVMFQVCIRSFQAPSSRT
jgi:hypothetical protein